MTWALAKLNMLEARPERLEILLVNIFCVTKLAQLKATFCLINSPVELSDIPCWERHVF